MTSTEEPGAPTVTALHIAPASRLPMRAVEAIEVRTSGGIIGDRYENSRHRHVTVQSQTELDEASAKHSAPIAPSDTRRNITLSHGTIPTTPGDRLSIGPVELEVVRIAAPCKLLEDALGPGAQAALRRRAGTVCRVLVGGPVRHGDSAMLSDAATLGNDQ